MAQLGATIASIGFTENCSSPANYAYGTVSIGKENDMKLRPSGKRCAPEGLPNLPGGMMRCHSMPGRAMTCPSGWMHEELQRMHKQSSDHQETLRATSAYTAQAMNGTLESLSGSIRPCTVAVERSPGGGRTQGARTMRPMTEGAVAYDGYDSRKHGWHDPRGQLEHARLTDPTQEGSSWAWTMRKARDHTGYEGTVSTGDTQVTAVSGNGPAWFLGTKTVPGPFSTKTIPVRRCPFNNIDGKHMKARGKTYEQGETLNIQETLHPSHENHAQYKLNGSNTVPESVRPRRAAHPMDAFNKATYCSLEHGGCQSKAMPMPLSRHIVHEGRTQRLSRSM